MLVEELEELLGKGGVVAEELDALLDAGVLVEELEELLGEGVVVGVVVDVVIGFDVGFGGRGGRLDPIVGPVL